MSNPYNSGKTTIPKWNDAKAGPFGNYTAQPQQPWRFKIDFKMSASLKKDKHYAIDRCPIKILDERFVNSNEMREGHGRFQALEMLQMVDGEMKTWDIGTLDIASVQYKKAPVVLNLYAMESTSLWVKKLAMLLRDCAIDRDTGFYFPFACRFPLDIELTTYGFRDGYCRLVKYWQCGIVKDKSYDMDYSGDEILENTLNLMCRRVQFANFAEDYSDVWH